MEKLLLCATGVRLDDIMGASFKAYHFSCNL